MLSVVHMQLLLLEDIIYWKQLVAVLCFDNLCYTEAPNVSNDS